ncbi:hypothetical protein TNCT_136951 [Trichonephila clavata]|uniref:Uncharacterized protein n=1 Tax=Trichonephila clavata TaxID=2740835 RepID=A0A8X6GUW0_TRICU|nr:hypothetical protein TNCT_136951 [Trichonephila clavata]
MRMKLTKRDFFHGSVQFRKEFEKKFTQKNIIPDWLEDMRRYYIWEPSEIFSVGKKPPPEYPDSEELDVG